MIPLILTYTGRHVNPLDLRPEDIDIEDIAHALANCNRFAGHCQRPISVAQHSVYVSRLVGKHEIWCALTNEICTCGAIWRAKQALLHDGAEAFLGDVTKWLKGTPEFRAYRDAEDRVQRQIYRAFCCPEVMYPEVAAADKLMLRFEGEMAFGFAAWDNWMLGLRANGASDYTPVTQEENEQIGPWGFWPWQTAKRGFLDRARSLGFEVPGDRPKNGRNRSQNQRSAVRPTGTTSRPPKG